LSVSLLLHELATDALKYECLLLGAARIHVPKMAWVLCQDTPGFDRHRRSFRRTQRVASKPAGPTLRRDHTYLGKQR